jgi:hypothetical protein
MTISATYGEPGCELSCEPTDTVDWSAVVDSLSDFDWSAKLTYRQLWATCSRPGSAVRSGQAAHTVAHWWMGAALHRSAAIRFANQ